MNTSCQALLPSYTIEIDDQVIELPIEISPHILILKKMYLELKCGVVYWQAMHKKLILREKKLKQKIEEPRGQKKDLRNRLFEKKSEKNNSSKNIDKSKSSKSKRPRGQQPCSKGIPETITAPMPPNVIPKISIWEAGFLNKFHYCHPTNRLLNQYAELGCVLKKTCESKVL